MIKTTAKLAVTVAFAVGTMSASAAIFDGSKPLLCALQHVTECETGAECMSVWTQEVNAPDFLQVDVTNKVISATPEAGTGRTTPIERSEHLDGKLVLQGADDGVEGVRDGLAWSMVIDDSTGKMIISAAGDGVAFAVFGACTLR